jgi:hypothetical protein
MILLLTPAIIFTIKKMGYGEFSTQKINPPLKT